MLQFWFQENAVQSALSGFGMSLLHIPFKVQIVAPFLGIYFGTVLKRSNFKYIVHNFSKYSQSTLSAA